MVGRLVEYIIPFKGLKEGIHQFEYQIDKRFLTFFKESQYHDCSIKAEVIFTNNPTFLIIEFSLRGTIKTECDRCMDEFDLPIEQEAKILVRLGNEFREESHDIIEIPAEESDIDLSGILYEYINLSVPYRKVHNKEKECNQENLKKLKKIEVKEKKKTDPRWDELKKLIN